MVVVFGDQWVVNIFGVNHCCTCAQLAYGSGWLGSESRRGGALVVTFLMV